jgi:hypothetical protein
MLISPYARIIVYYTFGTWAVEQTHLFTQIIPVLGGVDTGFNGRCPRCGVDRRTLVPRTFYRLPVDKKRDGVFGPLIAIVRFAGGYTRCRTGHNTSRNSPVLQDPATDIDMVR